MAKFFTLALLVGGASAQLMGHDQVHKATAGKAVMMLCRKSKHQQITPMWDKLMLYWNKGKDLKYSRVIEVDCSVKGSEPFCARYCKAENMFDYPKFRGGKDIESLEDVGGEHPDYDKFRKYMKDNFKPRCTPTQLDQCDETQKKEIQGYKNMDLAELRKLIDEKEKVIEQLQKKVQEDMKPFEVAHESVVKRHEEAQQKTVDTIAKIRKSGLDTMISCAALHGPDPDKKKNEL